jgi:hypothetical protein
MPRKILRKTIFALCAGAIFGPIALAQTTSSQNSEPVGANKKAPLPADSVELSLSDTRVIATRALKLGEFEVARQLAMGLLQADAQDPYAYGILTAAHARLQNPKLARAAARLSYKYSDDQENSFAAARNAGHLAFQQKRYTIAQIWLRRAAFHASTDQSEQVLARDFAKARAANPFRFNLRVSISPSDNVNNGTDTVDNLVNGIPQLGFIGAASRALSGTVGTADLRLQYNVRQDQTSRTQLNARIFTRQVALSSEARNLLASDPFASGLENSDFSSSYADIGVLHNFSLGKAGKTASVSGNVGRTWSGGERSYTFGRLGFNPSFRLNKQTRLTLRAGLEQRWYETNTSNDQTQTRLAANLQRKLKNGDRLSFGISLQDVSSAGRNIANQSGVANVNYAFGKQIGPLKVSAGLSVGYTRYSTFATTTPVAGGRTDTSVYGDVTMVFNELDFAGFVPSMQVRTGQRRSNISRYSTEELSVSLGIQSKF